MRISGGANKRETKVKTKRQRREKTLSEQFTNEKLTEPFLNKAKKV